MAIVIAVMAAADSAAAHGAEHKAGLPQLATETFAGQLFWLAITFVLLYAVLSLVVIPRIRGVLQARQGAIKGDLEAAALARSQADSALKAYEKSVDEARASARRTADEARAATKAEVDAKRTETEAKLAADIGAAETRIGQLKATAMANVKAIAAETAAEIVTRLSGEPLTAGDAAKAVDAALAR
jgi:F-type H+-transporting ATPase subunit b